MTAIKLLELWTSPQIHNLIKAQHYHLVSDGTRIRKINRQSKTK